MKKEWNVPVVEELDVRASMSKGADKNNPDGTYDLNPEPGVIITRTTFAKANTI